MPAGRLSWTMKTIATPVAPGRPASPERPVARVDRLVAWALLTLGLLLMLAGVSLAEQPSASRSERFQGPLKPGQTVRVDNISGDIVASPGKEFSAVVTITVSAPTRQKADEALSQTRVVSQHDEDGWSLETRWPGMNGPSRDGRRGSPCSGCRITVRYELLVPAGVSAELSTVNGSVRARDCDGELKLESVNGSIEATGFRRTIAGQTVNGKIEASATALPSDVRVDLQSVNGSVTLTLPKDARFEVSASTMNGTIASTFPLPVAPADSEELSTEEVGGGRGGKRVIVRTQDGVETEVDLRELERDLEGSLREAEASMEEGMREAEEAVREARRSVREAEREIRQIRISDPRRHYAGAIGSAGAQVDVTTLNGSVLLLAAGTREADAKPLVSSRRSFVVTVPEVRVHGAHPAPPLPPAAPGPLAAPPPPAAPLPPEPFLEGDVVRGDLAGDFLATSMGGSYRIGKVTGRVRILTHSGEIRVDGVGAGADLKTFGGDIVAGAVTGDLKASTMAGDIRAGRVSGSAQADTAGGDIRIESAGGNLDANTAGGDIVVPSVGGSVRAVTAGGDVRIGLTSCGSRGGVSIRDSGGDVTLWLPPDCKASLDLAVTGADRDERAIRSDFPDVSVSRRNGTERATLELNGGGEKIVVRTSSGTIRLRKGSAS
jgi:DUF4097 and DUF4098 domain-containing protein YvlB